MVSRFVMFFAAVISWAQIPSSPLALRQESSVPPRQRKRLPHSHRRCGVTS